MDPDAIVYTDHAAQRMEQRGIGTADVRRVLLIGDITPAKNDCLEARGTIRKREMSVIFVEVGTSVESSPCSGLTSPLSG